MSYFYTYLGCTRSRCSAVVCTLSGVRLIMTLPFSPAGRAGLSRE
jgi:hypothetical protein